MRDQVKEISVVIPALNEAHVIGETVGELRSALERALSLDFEIMVIDDGSSDGTGDAASASGCRVIRHRTNRGYGASLKTGIQAARKEVVLFYDADGQFDPADLRRLIVGLAGADMAAGIRGKGSHRPIERRPGKWVLRIVADYLSRTKIPDLNCGYRVVRRKAILPYLHLLPDGFSASTTTTILFLKKKMAINWVPVTIRKTKTKSSVKIFKDGFDTMLLILRLITLFDPLRIYLPASALCVMMAVIWGTRYVLKGQGLSLASMFLLISAALIFFFGLLADQVSALRLGGLEKEGD